MAAGGAYVFPAPTAGRCRLAAALVLAVAMTVDKAINYGAARVYRARNESVCTDAHVYVRQGSTCVQGTPGISVYRCARVHRQGSTCVQGTPGISGLARH